MVIDGHRLYGTWSSPKVGMKQTMGNRGKYNKMMPCTLLEIYLM